jgi:hypothetical protein
MAGLGLVSNFFKSVSQRRSSSAFTIRNKTLVWASAVTDRRTTTIHAKVNRTIELWLGIKPYVSRSDVPNQVSRNFHGVSRNAD